MGPKNEIAVALVPKTQYIHSTYVELNILLMQYFSCSSKLTLSTPVQTLSM